MLTQTRTPIEMERQARQELGDGEELLWIGQPDPGRLARQAKSIVLCLFGIPFTLFAIGWETMAVRMAMGLPMMPTASPMPPGNTPPMAPPAPFQGMMLLFLLFGLPFVLTGLWLLTSPYWTWRKAQKIVYAVTNTRVFMLIPAWRGRVSVRTVTPEHPTDRTRTLNGDGSGTLIFNRLTQQQSGGEGGTVIVTVGFEHIPDVQGVDALIGRTFERAGG